MVFSGDLASYRHHHHLTGPCRNPEWYAASLGEAVLQTKPGRTVWLALTAVLIASTLLFYQSFFNRFLGLRSGDGEYVCGMALLSGILPYRDYYLTAPPLNILKAALLLKTFGGTLLVLRIAGVVERLLIALVLFRWLARIFRPWHALVAAVVTIIVSSGDRSDPIASYNHDAILFALLGGFAASLALDGGRLRRTAWLGVGAGASTSLSVLTKQTVGIGAIAAVLVAGVVLLAKLYGSRRAAVWCIAFITGCIVPLNIVAAWLQRKNLLHASLHMLFVSGPAAKAGHFTGLLAREFTIARGNPVWVALAALAVAMCWRPIRRGLHGDEPPRQAEIKQAAWVFAACLLVTGTAEALAYTSLPALRDFSKTSVYFVVMGLTLWLIHQTSSLLRVHLSRRIGDAILFAAVAWSITATLSLSWPAFEAMTLPGLGFLLAATLNGVRDRFRWFPLLVMAAMVFLQVREKLAMPFGFNHQDEAAVRFASATSSRPQLRGLRLAPSAVDLLEATSRTVQAASRPGDTIFTYPEMSLLYTLTDRRPPTFALSHNIDVVSDALARDEARELLRARPAVIVYYRVREEDLRADELTWRHGERSGQRDLIAAIESLVSHYRLTGTYFLAPGDPPIDIYVRP